MGQGSGGCDERCQKILLCMTCAAYNLLAQDTAQRQWVRDGNPLHPDFNGRQTARLVTIQKAIDECYVAIGTGCQINHHPRLKQASDSLIELSKPRALSLAVQLVLIEKSEVMEKMIDANQVDYLTEIGYKAA